MTPTTSAWKRGHFIWQPVSSVSTENLRRIAHNRFQLEPEYQLNHGSSVGSIKHNCSLIREKQISARIPPATLQTMESTAGVGPRLLSQIKGVSGLHDVTRRGNSVRGEKGNSRAARCYKELERTHCQVAALKSTTINGNAGMYNLSIVCV